MRLVELLELASQWEREDETIYVAQPWSCDTDAILVSPAPDTTEPVVEGGHHYDYFLETFIARDFIEDYVASDEGVRASDRERCERLIRYAQDDA